MCWDARVVLESGELQAAFLPHSGMLGASLSHRGAELLRRVDDLQAVRARGGTAGIPLLYPWANRLGSFRYRAAGREVDLDPDCALLRLDANGLPIHGVPWPMLAWEVTASTRTSVCARLDWSASELVAIFPFPHHVEMAASLDGESLTIATTVFASGGMNVPVSFGFHPYFGLPGIARDDWRLALPAMRSLALDARLIPNGAEQPFRAMDAALAGMEFDDGFAIRGDAATLSLSGAGRRISLDLVDGYGYAQVYAPKGGAFVALEPMTAATNALESGRGLRVIAAGSSFSATFRIRIGTI